MYFRTFSVKSRYICCICNQNNFEVPIFISEEAGRSANSNHCSTSACDKPSALDVALILSIQYFCLNQVIVFEAYLLTLQMLYYAFQNINLNFSSRTCYKLMKRRKRVYFSITSSLLPLILFEMIVFTLLVKRDPNFDYSVM